MSPIVGRPVARVDGREKVTGTATYAADALVRGVLHGFLVVSTIARGRVTRIDTGAAERAPGVRAVFTHRTMPRLKVPTHPSFIKKVLPLQDAHIHHSGQPVAFVVADTLEQAQHAATLVQVSYDERIPQVVLADAMDEAYVPAPGSDGPNEITRGDPAKGFAQADVRVDVTYTTPMQHHQPMEPSAALAVWEGERLTLHESAQGVTVIQACVAEALGVPLENVRVLSPYLGGGFGAKGPWPSTLLTAAVARKLKRPVELVLTVRTPTPRTGTAPKATSGCGSARSGTARSPHYAQTPASASTQAAYPPYVQDLKAQNVADSSPASPALPIARTAGLVTAGAATAGFAPHRRRTRAGGTTPSV